MSGKDKSAAGGAVRKTEEGAKAPPAEELAKTEADAKAKTDGAKTKKAANDKASKAKREKEATAKKLADEVAAKRCGYYIKPGLAITSKKGIVAGAPKGSEVWEGDKVTLKHFDEEVGARLFDSGAIVEVK